MTGAVEFVVHYGYLMLFCWLVIEQGGLPVPSVPLLLACGALVRAGRLNPMLVLLSALVACLLADSIWFQLGRRKGGKVLSFLCRVALEPDSCVRQTENILVRYGLRALLVAKFVPGLNAVAAPLAGSGGVSFRRFLLFDSSGALLWITSVTALGYIFADQLEDIAAFVMRTGTGVVTVLVALLAGWIGWKFAQRRRFLRKLTVSRITAEELRDKIQAGAKVLLVDLRHHRGGAQEEVPGALRIPAEELAARHDEIPRDRDIILFCS